MKTIVIESICPKPHLETAGEIALNLKKKGNNVSFAWIGSDIFWHEWKISKFFKIFGNNPQKRVNAFLEILKQNKINIIETKDKHNTNLIEDWASKFKGNINDLKKYKYKNMPLGIGAASSLIAFYNNFFVFHFFKIYT